MSESDLKSRLPDFRRLSKILNKPANRAAFTAAPEDVQGYLDALVPVGVGRAGKIVMPQSYDSEKNIPVLMLDYGEEHHWFTLGASAAEIAKAQSVNQQHGNDAPVEPDSLKYAFSMNPKHGAAVIKSDQLLASSKGERRRICVPRLMVVQAGISRGRLPTVIPHEIDHWVYYMQRAAAINRSQPSGLTFDQDDALTEKKAYTVSYAVEKALGYHDKMPSVGEFAARHAGVLPEDSDQILKDFDQQERKAKVRGKTSVALAVLAVEHIFGRPDMPATPDEIKALKTLGVL